MPVSTARSVDRTDLFEELRDGLGCDYISDMKVPPYRERAKRHMAKKALEKYPLHVLNDVADYLYGGKHRFGTTAQAYAFFREDGRKMQE